MPQMASNKQNYCDNTPIFFTGLTDRKAVQVCPLICLKCGIEISSLSPIKTFDAESAKYCTDCSNDSYCENSDKKLQELSSKIDFNLLKSAIRRVSSVSSTPSNAKRKTLLPLPSPNCSQSEENSSYVTKDKMFGTPLSTSTPKTKDMDLKRKGSFQREPAKRHKNNSTAFSPPKCSSGDELSREIWSLFLENKQTDEVYQQKMTLRDKLHEILLDRFPSCGLYVVGSSMTGLGANSSDMDMCLMLTDFEIDQVNEATNILHMIYSLFINYSFLVDVEIIYAKVPILRFKDSISGIEVDLNVNNTVGIRNTQLLSSYARIDKRLPPLVVLVKLWARSRGINDAKNNTLSSYSLVLMVIHYLQYRCEPPVLPCLQSLQPDKFLPNSDVRKLKLLEDLPSYTSKNTEDLGSLFIGFLKYFADEFDYHNSVMSVRLGSVMPKVAAIHTISPKNKKGHWKWVCIEEPFDLTNTACAMFKPDIFYDVKRVFQSSWRTLKNTENLSSIFR